MNFHKKNFKTGLNNTMLFDSFFILSSKWLKKFILHKCVLIAGTSNWRTFSSIKAISKYLILALRNCECWKGKGPTVFVVLRIMWPQRQLNLTP
jgi:hypothetical protein